MCSGFMQCCINLMGFVVIIFISRDKYQIILSWYYENDQKELEKIQKLDCISMMYVVCV
jgi:hypothetical protein